MKIFTRFILLVFLLNYVTMVKAQFDYNQWWAFDVYLLKYNPVEIKNSGEYSEARLTVTKNGNTEKFIKRYNEKGLLTEYYRGKNNDSIEKKAVLIYDDQFRLQKVNRYDKHKLHHQYLYEFNEKGMITQLLKNDSDGEVIKNRAWRYNTDGYVEEATESKKKSIEIKYTWKYEYYEIGKLSKITEYKYEELKEEWDYMCNQTGEMVTRKNLNKLCKWHESSKDTLTAIYQSTDDKGKTRKTVYKYTLDDTLILAEIHYNDKNEIRLKKTYDKSFDKQLSHTWYKKGKPSYQSIDTYIDGKLASSIGKTKDKMVLRTEYVYDKDNLLIEYRRYGKKDKLKEEIKVEYVK